MGSLKKFFEHEIAGGVVLMIATVMALVFQNSFLSEIYNSFLHTHFAIGIGDVSLDEPLHFWVNDCLMAIFFFQVGLELKREMCEGHLKNPAQIILPSIAALGGITVPALIFTAFVWGDDFGMRGWAIPTATDIAFSLGVLSLLGSRVPTSLKVFLMTLAIIDDLGAIIIIALFYTSNLSWIAFGVAAVCIILLAVLSARNSHSRMAYLILGILLWLAILQSGIHATLAGVITAFFIPIAQERGGSMLKNIEHHLHGWVTFGVLPIFAFVNAGISFEGIDFAMITSPVPMGIILGLLIGKQVGVFSVSFVMIKLGLAKLPAGATWFSLYGVSILCGIGFTMSLFVDGLAYLNANTFLYTDKLAIPIGSLLSAIIGYVVLKVAIDKQHV